MNKKISVFTILNYAFFVLIGIVMLYPFWYVVMYAFSDPGLSTVSNLYLVPSGFTLQSFQYALAKKTVYSGFANSVFLTLVGTTVNMILTTTLAYPLSKDNLPGRKAVNSLIVFTMLFNGGMIPTYLVVKQFGLLDSLWSLILSLAVNVYNLMIMIKFFKGIPEALIESAKIDGCNDFYIFLRIVLPLSKAVLATIGLFYAVQHWNEFLKGMIYINDQAHWPLQVVLRDVINQVANDLNNSGEAFLNPENFKMATIVITVAPILCVYPFLQKYFTSGVMLGSVKG